MVRVKLKIKYLTLFMSILLLLLMAFLRNTNFLDVKAAPTENNLTEIVNIETAEDLNKLADSEYLGRTFLLKNDIDLIGINWTPLDTYEMSGTFDGGGHAMKNLTVNVSDEYTGLFSKNGLNIRNLFMDSFSIDGGKNSGGLAGLNKGKIDNVHIIGNISSNYSAGGLIAENYGDIDNCSFDGRVTSRTAAGLVGSNSSSTIINSYSIGEVKGQKIGGLISSAFKASSQEQKISNSFSFCEMTLLEYDETIKRIGGFIAVREQGVLIENCYSGDDFPCIAFGDFNGVKELSTDKQKDKNSYSGFDFGNYWNWCENNKTIEQKTIAVSSNAIEMNGTVVIVKGDKSYYNKSETATLKLDSGNVKNIAIKTIHIDEKPSTIVDGGIIRQEYKINISMQVNIFFTVQYLITASIKKESVGFISFIDKHTFQPNETIMILIKKIDGYENPTLILEYSRNNATEKIYKIVDDYDSEFYYISVKTDVLEYSASEKFYLSIYYDEKVSGFLIAIISLSIILVLGILALIALIVLRKKKVLKIK